MKLNELIKTTARSSKRLGRGLGSGKGKTGGRGSKGQKARGKVKATFSGGGLPLYKKLPYLRGEGNTKGSPKPLIVKLSALNAFKSKTLLDLDALISSKIVNEKQARKYGVKILDSGEITVALNIKLPASKKAIEKIQKAGGTIV